MKKGESKMKQIIIDYAFKEQSIDFQKVCLGGKLTTQDVINERRGSAHFNLRNSCSMCFIKNHKLSGQCTSGTCPIQNAHDQVIVMLNKIEQLLIRNPDADLPHIKASDYTLDYILEVYEEAIQSNNLSPATGLDKIKTFFGGK
jgi:uncharacterized protein